MSNKQNIVVASKPELQQISDNHWLRFVSKCESEQINVLELSDFKEDIKTLFGLSEFVAEAFIRQPKVFIRALKADTFNSSKRYHRWEADLAQASLTMNTEMELKSCIRQFRLKQMVVIAWRDLLGLAGLAETLMHLSKLADVIVGFTYQWWYQYLAKKLGYPVDSNKEKIPLVILAMGKFGGHELNFSSDIDLIFTYPEDGMTIGGRKSIDNHQFFLRLGQRLIVSLNEQTSDGFVYRVDMRLRPYGDSGPLVISFDALEDYLQEQGREWERFAMVKALPLTGELRYREKLQMLLKPFVFRRYIDFGVLDSIRSMKAMINKEVRRRQLDNNIKLGAGGIREVEFIVQAMQLIRGGRDTELQQTPLLEMLDLLLKKQYLPAEMVDELRSGYCFLRKLEHSLQEIADRQTQTLPKDDINQARLCLILGFDNWAQLMHRLKQVCERIHFHFSGIFGEQEKESKPNGVAEVLMDLWQGTITDKTINGLQALGFSQEQTTIEKVQGFACSRLYLNLGPKSKKSLDNLMPVLLHACTQVDDPQLCLERILHLLKSIVRRNAYLQLLLENPPILQHLVDLVANSSWIANHLTQFPLLLDELLYPQTLYQQISFRQLDEELTQAMLRIEQGDVEQQMETLRVFKLSHELRAASADIAGVTDVRVTSRYLTDLAEVIVKVVIDFAWRDLVNKHGLPGGLDSGQQKVQGFAVVGYGKLGSGELGYGSDLDLVFLYQADAFINTQGQKPIENNQFFTRLAQRVVHFLSTRTSLGMLYQVDTRLRPSGNSGL